MMNKDLFDILYLNEHKKAHTQIERLYNTRLLLERKLRAIDKKDKSNQLYIELLEFMISTMNAHIDMDTKYKIFTDKDKNKKVFENYIEDYKIFLKDALKHFHKKHLNTEEQ